MIESPESANASALRTVREKDEWLKTLYTEAWKQYAHEDTLVQARTNIFLVIQAICLAFLGATLTAVGKVGCATFVWGTINLGLTLLGVIWVGVSALLLLLGTRFKKVTEAG